MKRNKIISMLIAECLSYYSRYSDECSDAEWIANQSDNRIIYLPLSKNDYEIIDEFINKILS